MAKVYCAVAILMCNTALGQRACVYNERPERRTAGEPDEIALLLSTTTELALNAPFTLWVTFLSSPLAPLSPFPLSYRTTIPLSQFFYAPLPCLREPSSGATVPFFSQTHRFIADHNGTFKQILKAFALTSLFPVRFAKSAIIPIG